MQTICSMKMGKASGSRENGWSIRIHMEQAARSVRQLPQGLAEDWDLETSVRRAKAYMQRAIGAGLDLGQGNGPLEHMVW